MITPADGPVPDATAQSLIADLTARLLTGSSATAVLEAWCTERGFPDADLLADPIPGPQRPLKAAQRERLRLGDSEAVRHRRVRLVCGARVLSVADNWYVPARLTPAMNRSLDATRAPFGRVVHPLAPTRHTLGLRVLRGPGLVPAPDEALFAVQAVLATPDGVAFCEVEETYFGSVLGGSASYDDEEVPHPSSNG
jgi:hypothetical protein